MILTMSSLALDETRLLWPREVTHVGLVGWPTCGKTTFAEMLEDEFNGQIVDDGLILRRALPILLGGDPQAPFSQEGKATSRLVGDRTETVREGLGELGNYIEARYGEDIVPVRAMEIARQEHPNARFYIYPSVRKRQGRVYRRAGGIVIQVDRPGADDSGNVFDRWDQSNVDLIVRNDGSLADLRARVQRLPDLIAARFS